MASKHTSHSMCPKCGTKEWAFVGVFCQSCFLKDHPKLIEIPSKLEIEKCNRCGKVRVQGQWKEWDDDSVHRWIKEKVKAKGMHDVVITLELRPHPKEEKEMRVKVMVSGEIEQTKLDLTLYATLFIRSNICNDDMLISSDYYEAIIQVRFPDRTVERVRSLQDELVKALAPIQKLDSKAVVVNWALQTNGFDAWIVSSKAAKAAAVYLSRQHKGTISVSNKQIGLDTHTSKTKYRFTYLVRLPEQKVEKTESD